MGAKNEEKFGYIAANAALSRQYVTIQKGGGKRKNRLRHKMRQGQKSLDMTR